MKSISLVLAALALLFTDLAFGAGAIVTSVTGMASAQAGTAPTRILRQGDQVNQGETIVTGSNSSIVLKFDDGQIAALTSASRMTITAYQYEPTQESGNVFLSLITGGMRTITGLIGRRSPSNVAYRAATATIGIRGTSNFTLTDGTTVLETVDEGSVTVRFGDQSLVISAGEAAYFQPGKPTVTGTLAQVMQQLPPNIAEGLAQNAALNAAIQAAFGGTGSGSAGNPPDTGNNGTTGQSGGAQGGAGSGGGGGNGSGGRASGS